ncbi:MAG: SHOCT domain-containing protein [Bacillota bacterium]
MLLNLFNPVFAQAGMFNGRFGRHYFGFGGGILMVVLWIIIIVGAIWLIKENISSKNNNSQYSQHDADRYRNETPKDEEKPEEIARKRLAKGEITREEYEEIIKTLKED